LLEKEKGHAGGKLGTRSTSEMEKIITKGELGGEKKILTIGEGGMLVGGSASGRTEPGVNKLKKKKTKKKERQVNALV